MRSETHYCSFHKSDLGKKYKLSSSTELAGYLVETPLAKTRRSQNMATDLDVSEDRRTQQVELAFSMQSRQNVIEAGLEQE